MADAMTPEQVIEAKHALAGMAEILHDYFVSLRDEGFSKREALQIVLGYQRSITGGSDD